jgi:hypothetical protein
MVQVIQRSRYKEDRPSIAESFFGAFGESAKKGIEEHQQKAKNMAALKPENEQILKQTGIDLSGITDPKLRQTYVAAALQGENAKDLEKLKLGQKKKEQEANEELVESIAQQRGIDLTPQQKKSYAKNPSLFAQVSKPPKEPQGTQASKPIDAGQLKIMDEVESSPEWETASIPQKTSMMQRAGVSKENTKSRVDTIIEDKKIDAENKKATAKTDAANRKEELQFHKESEEYEKELAKGNKSAEHQLNAIKDVEKALKSKKTSPTSLANIFSFFGKTGKKLADSILTEDQATIAASVPAFLEGRKELFGVRLSDADLAILEDKLPSMGKSQEANKAILKIMKKYSQGSQLRYKIANEIKSKNKGLRPLGFSNRVEERYEEMTSTVRMRTPNGNIIEVPAYQVSDAISQGVTLENE